MEKFFLSIIGVLLISCNVATERSILADTTTTDFQQQVRDFYVDELDYIYVITDKNEIHRCDAELNILFTYSNKRLGRIYSIDVSNPLKILVYFKDYQVVATLDNTLTESSQLLDLNDFNHQAIKAIGLSVDNQLWMYNPIEYKLQKIDQNGHLLQESQSLRQENLIDFDPDYVYECSNHIYLIEKEKNLLCIFDDYGMFLKSLADINLQSYQILQNGKLIVDDGAQYVRVDPMAVYDASTPLLDRYDSTSKFHFQNNTIVLLHKNKTIEVKPIN